MDECQETPVKPNKLDKENTGDLFQNDESKKRNPTNSSEKAGNRDDKEKTVNNHADKSRVKSSQVSQERKTGNNWTRQEENDKNKRKHDQWDEAYGESNQRNHGPLEYTHGDSSHDGDQSDVAKVNGQDASDITDLKSSISYSDALKKDIRQDPYMVRKSAEVIKSV